MLQFYKVLTIIMRVFTKPFINYTKHYQIQRHKLKHSRVRDFLIYIGNKTAYFEYQMDTYIVSKDSKEFNYPPMEIAFKLTFYKIYNKIYV